ncbi:DUF2752 domain-containing protein [Pelagicoccus sp. NFK12]|uniref:DUF2752 domain-containing protein n=1 Tax=Pelagicoccus enzymogenes TaxID=2773457 RepID=A0A927FDG1_9BACT|nr:DUF2752 domain-containing protein [Pelagicoccus enzymogenes]MBD5782389.1 DUF2752 domain-containing protein [Pelagicoccus enzymogenes]MDQ8200979.1 DUF2752 domain-containing protein [Pelagicoccus enzymogenes]
MTDASKRPLGKKRLGLGIAWLLPFPLAWAYYYRYEDWHTTTCVYKTFTGYDCAFCGLTRAFANATHGHFQTAFELNVTWPFYFILFLLVGFAYLSAAFGKSDALLSFFQSLWKNHYWKILAAIVLTTFLL